MERIAQPVSIIVPTLNEAGNLELLFERIHTTMHKAGIPYEIVIVDDYSTDGTVAIAQNADPSYHVRLLTKQGQRGKAFSLLEGFAAAEYDLVCMIDGDLQYPPEAIGAMYHKMHYCDADVIITERIDNKTSALRRLSSAIYNFFFIKLLFGINYDTQSGLKLFKKKILHNVTLSPSPWSFDLEFIVRTLEQDYTILNHEIAFSKRHAGVPKVHMLSTTMELSAAALRLWHGTSTKRVRLNYKNLQVLQRSVMCFVAVSLAVIGISFHDAPKASALSLQPVATATQSATHLSEQLVQSTARSADPVNSSPRPSSPTTTASSRSRGGGVHSQPAAVTAAPGSTSTISPSASNAAGKPLNDKTTNASTGNSGGTTDSAALQAVGGKQAKYYPTSKLSTTKTQQFLKVALSIVIAGAILVAVSGLIIMGKSLSKRIHRQPIRT